MVAIKLLSTGIISLTKEGANLTLLQRFIENRKFESVETTQGYSSVIARFVEQFGENLEELTIEAMNDYLYGKFSMYSYSKDNETHYKKYAITTFEKHINIIRSFLNFSYENGFILHNYAAEIKATEQERSITKGQLPEVDEINKIIDMLETQVAHSKEYTSIRNLSIFNLVFHSGISTNEISSIDLDDISVIGSTYQLSIHKPTYRRVPINSTDAALLMDLIKYRKQLYTEDEALFISIKNKKRLSRRSIGYLVNKYCEDASIKVYSAETFSKAGMLAALSIGYDVTSLSEDLNIKEDYLKRRVRFSGLNSKVASYSDLFERRLK